MISLSNKGYSLWTKKLYQSSSEETGGQKQVKLEDCTQGPNFRNEISYDIPDPHILWYFDSKLIGLYWSLEVKNM